MRLDDLIQYEMTDLEIKAARICYYWQEIVAHELPNYRTYKVPSKKDPRKCYLFKFCYKLANETQGLLTDSDYRYYVYAQISTLKNFTDGTIHSLVDPQILIGENAWRRWKIWKYKFDKKMVELETKSSTEDVIQPEHIVLTELKNTKEFLDKISNLDIEKEFKDHRIHKWLYFKKISPYFLILSKKIKSLVIDYDKEFSLENNFYEKSITENIRKQFLIIFGDF